MQQYIRPAIYIHFTNRQYLYTDHILILYHYKVLRWSQSKFSKRTDTHIAADLVLCGKAYEHLKQRYVRQNKVQTTKYAAI